MNFTNSPVLSDAPASVSSSVFNLPFAPSLVNPLPQPMWQGASATSAIAFIDASVPDYQSLLAGIAPDIEVYLLDSSQDAITQITNTLLGRQNITSLHVVSHGETGALGFGSSTFNLNALPQYADQLKTWSTALTNDADILLYGCNIAEGEVGQAFVHMISQLTGADVAASNNLTGQAGDWNLEVNTGAIESALAFNTSATAAYAYDLNILGETFRGNDVTNPSWIYNTSGTQPFLTARSTATPSTGGIPGGGTDAVGSGALRLTSAATNQASFVIYNRPINAADGLSIAFNIHAYGGNGADGISFFLIDGNASPTQSGAVGGALGYSLDSRSASAAPGLVGGYIGIGFDEFGNFSNPDYGSGGPGPTADAIAVRGSQASSYQYLAGTGTLTPGIDVTGGTRSTAQKAVQIDLTPAGLLSVRIDLNNDGDFLDTNEAPATLQNYNVVANNGALPSTFKFGFSASTGGSTNIHEITGLDVDTFGSVPYTPLVNFTGSTASVTEGSALTLTAQLDAATTNVVTVPITVSGTATNNTDYTLSNTTITILPGQLTGSVTLNALNDALSEPNETIVVTLGTPTGAQLSPQNNVLTTTLVNSISPQSVPSLLWRNSSNGQNAVWLLNNFTLQSSYYLPEVIEPGWQVVSSTADFNSDGIADILWRNSVTGSNAIWQMNSSGYETGYFITPVADVNWQIVSTANFNNDTTPDILWRNASTGENAIWQMNGFTVQTTAFITRVADTNWQIAGTGNFSGDRIPDILWRNAATGENAIWQMNGFTVQTTAFITPVFDPGWQIEGTGNFNGDATDDIVWRNVRTGENAIWQMNGITLQSGYFINSLTVLDWQIAGVADLGGDSTPEILWRNNQAGQELIWQLSGFTFSQSYQLTDVVEPNWSVTPFVVARSTVIAA
ncbi:MAG: DUF4347 domain-containing protein [Stenomitos frigidus ULC029]